MSKMIHLTLGLIHHSHICVCIPHLRMGVMKFTILLNGDLKLADGIFIPALSAVLLESTP